MKALAPIEMAGVVDRQLPRVALSGSDRQRGKHDRKWYRKRSAGLEARRAAGLESTLNHQGMLIDLHCMTILIEKIEAPGMADVRPVPWNLDADGNPHRLWSRPDHRQAAAEHVQLSIRDLSGIGQKHRDAKSRRCGGGRNDRVHDGDPRL